MQQKIFLFHIPRFPRLSQLLVASFNPPTVDTERIYDILSQYGLKLTKAPKNLLGGYRNRNIIVNTSNGKKVLKRYQDGWPVSTVVHEHSILTHLSEVNFPAPRLVPASDSRTCVNYQNDMYVLFDFIKGVNYSDSMMSRSHRLKLARIAGQTQARLHRALDGFVPTGSHHVRGFESYTGKRHQDMAWYEHALQDLKAKSQSLAESEAREPANWLIQKSAYLFEELQLCYQSLESAPLHRLVIHGDYGTHNILIQRNGVTTPIDLEGACIEWRSTDLALSMARYRFSKTTVSYDFELMHHHLMAYHAEFPLTVDELQLLPQVWRFRKLNAAVQFWISYFDTNGPTRKLFSARDAINQADWAMKSPEKLIALIS